MFRLLSASHHQDLHNSLNQNLKMCYSWWDHLQHLWRQHVSAPISQPSSGLLLLLGPVRMNAPVSTAALGLLCHHTQPRFRSPVPRVKRQRSLTEAVRMSVGSTTRLPKTLKRLRAKASQQQIMRCTVSTSFMQNLQIGSPSSGLTQFPKPESAEVL
jgi:hypothetical protein